MARNGDAEEFLGATRQLIAEARALMAAREAARATDSQGVLGLYESLCGTLDGIDPARVTSLLARIAEQVEHLNALAGQVERLRRLRQGMRAG